MTSRNRLAAVAAVGLIAVTAGNAVAYWELTAPGQGKAASDSLGTSGVPQFAARTPTRTVSATVAPGTSAAGRATGAELLRVASATDTTVLAASPCSGSPLTCAESNVPEGRHWYATRQTAGTQWKGTALSATASVLVDATAPTATAATSAAWTNQPVKSTVIAKDDRSSAAEVSGVSSLAWTASGATSASGTVTVSPSPSPATAYSAESAVISDEGTTTVAWTATDAHGSTSTSSSQVIRIDRTAPLLTISETSPASSGTESRPTFTGNRGTVAESTSASADSATVTVTITGPGTSTSVVSTGAAAVSGGTWSYQPATGLAPGTYSVAAEQLDAAGNRTTVSRSYAVTEAPLPAPSNVQASRGSGNRLTATWSPVTGAASYECQWVEGATTTTPNPSTGWNSCPATGYDSGNGAVNKAGTFYVRAVSSHGTAGHIGKASYS